MVFSGTCHCPFRRRNSCLLSSGFKTRYLVFGKEEGYSQTALSAYFAAHKIGSLGEKDKDKVNAAWDNAAHATVTGSGLLIIVKAKALDIPLNIINLVFTHSQYNHMLTCKLG